MDWNALLDQVVHYAIQAAVAALMPLVVGIAIQALRRLNISLSEKQQERVNRFATEAAQYAEERVSALVKIGIVKTADAAQRKLGEALAHMRETAPRVPDDQARLMITKALPRVGLGASAPDGAPQVLVAVDGKTVTVTEKP